MRIIETTFARLGASALALGYAGEHLATQVRVDCTEALAGVTGGSAALKLRAPDGTLYPGTISLTDGVAVWTVRDTDTVSAGYGHAQLDILGSDGTVLKTAVTDYLVRESLTGESGEAPDPIEDWLDEAGAALTDTLAATAAANGAAALAAEKAALAAEKAALADTKAGLADTKAGLANDAAALAGTKAGLANDAAALAAEKAALADAKAGLANGAAAAANAAAAGIEDELAKKANVDGYYADLVSGASDQLISTVAATDKVPYNFRTSGGSLDIGDRETDMLVGGTIVWNQLVGANAESVTVTSGHKYISMIGGVWAFAISDGTAISVTGGTDMAFDMTLMFGSAIADYVYSLEQATAGAGVAWFRRLFPKSYYAYDAGSLQSVQAASHDTVGFNAYDNTAGTARLVGSMQYQITGAYTALTLDGAAVTPDADGYFTPAANGVLTVTGGDGTTTCVHLVWDGERDGEYEPYVKHSYPLDASLTLRGVPKLDANNVLYYDGDTYASDGAVTRKYGIVDLGTLTWSTNGTGYGQAALNGIAPSASSNDISNIVCDRYVADTQTRVYNATNDKTISGATNATVRVYDASLIGVSSANFKAALSGVYLVYEFATPATEAASPYTNPQIVNAFGTEEYVDAGVTASTPTRDVAIPVGHVTQYMQNLRAKLEMAPDSPDTDGDYILRHANGQNAYTALVKELPAAPSTDGTYSLKCTIASGTATLTWEADAE